MPRYVLLVDWTDQGVQAVEQTVDRLEHGAEIGETFGSRNCARPTSSTDQHPTLTDRSTGVRRR